MPLLLNQMACIDLRGMVGKIYEEEYYTLLHTKMKAMSLVVSKKNFFYVCPIVSLWELMTPEGGGGGHFLPQGHDSHDLCKAPHNNAAYQTEPLPLVVSEKINVFPIISLWPVYEPQRRQVL